MSKEMEIKLKKKDLKKRMGKEIKKSEREKNNTEPQK